MTIADAQALQQRASNPDANVWVSASAGSGKTTVLVSRILRLLLANVEPHRILCLTYTKAAAMEMRIRLSRILSQWATLEAAQLNDDLARRTGEEPTEKLRARARQLFAIISDAPDALRIQTIHAFCQSILARFPVEAGLSPGFVALDETQAAPLLRRAIDQTWTQCGDEVFERAKNWCAARFGFSQMESILPGLMHEFPEISAHMDVMGEAQYWQETFATLQVPEDEKEIWHNAFADAALPLAALRAWLAAREDEKLDNFLSFPDRRGAMQDAYVSLFLTKDLEPRKRLLTKDITKTLGHHADDLLAEQQRIYEISNRAKEQRLAIASAAMGIVLARANANYQRIKSARSALDFSDMIQKTHQLLASPGMGQWVHYKLEGGIDHVLVDEAQDTAPLQWKVIVHLIDEFFAGAGRSQRTRSLFVVGDPKQSIYSFQGADARVFQLLRRELAARAHESRSEWVDVPMRYSFRTSGNLLAAVDEAFADIPLQGRDEATQHQTIHAARKGQIKIYPAIPAPERKKFAGLITDEDETKQQHNELLAHHIAAVVKDWLTTGRVVSSTREAVQPKDILILLQQRTSLADNLLAALRNANIPVLGNDRLKLLDAPAVQDLMAFCRFLLLPDDDLNLAILLRSPLIHLDEKKLYELSQRARGVSLWQSLLQSDETEIKNYLGEWLARADLEGAYPTLAEMLSRPCPAAESGWRALHARLGPECDDPVNEILSLALREGQPDAPLGLEQFIHWLVRADIEIKREMAQHDENAVRILTVHGAKGLEAPIVILADATEDPHESGNKKPRAVPSDRQIPLFWFAPDKSAEGASFDRSENRHMRAAEYQRLLYVALTRAEHELHIFGKTSRKGDVADGSWYPQIRAAVRTLGAEEISEGFFHFGAEDDFAAATTETRRAEKSANPWLQLVPHEAPSPPRPMAVTHYLQQKYPIIAREYAASPGAARRGTIMHRLLELLPALPGAQQADAALRFIQRQVPTLSQDEADSWTAEVMRVLHSPDISPFFSPTAYAEASIGGEWQGARLTGSVDRFYVTDTEIRILDFKTTANPPPPGEIPPQYMEQLRIYAAFLAELFPMRNVCAGILWTASLRMDWLDAENLRLVA